MVLGHYSFPHMLLRHTVEQDRAPPILVHHSKLAGQTAGQLSRHRRIDRRDTTQTGLTVRCELDDKTYPKGIVVSEEQMQSLNIKRADFHGEWNYTIAPLTQKIEAVDS